MESEPFFRVNISNCQIGQIFFEELDVPYYRGLRPKQCQIDEEIREEYEDDVASYGIVAPMTDRPKFRDSPSIEPEIEK